MRIGIDARLWNETGVGRYIRNLVLELAKIDKKNSYVVFVTPQAMHSDIFASIENTKNWKLVVSDIRWHTVEEQLLFYKVLETEALDLVHFPYFSIPILYNKPYVFTIHDLIINHFPTGKASKLPLPLYYMKRLGYQMVLKQAAKNAKKIITVSEATKEEILDHLSVKKEKVVITYEGIEPVLQRAKTPPVRIEKLLNIALGEKIPQYFLYVGNAYPHKNVERLVDAFALTLASYPQAKLVMVGQKNFFYDRLEEKVRSLKLENAVIFTGGVSDLQLKALYENAHALVLPSLMEGFGLPGLEAMQLECLVLASDIPVFKEIYEDAAVFFDPLDITQIDATMQKVLKEQQKFKKYKQNGLAISQKYSWKKMAQQTLEIYENSISLR